MKRLLILLLLLVPTIAAAQQPCPKCGRIHAVTGAVQGLLPYEVNRDPAAYAHAKREASILASQGRVYHPLGCAPGTRYSGTGNSYNGQPNHCYRRELPESRLVARACVRGRNGSLYWSAHYR